MTTDTVRLVKRYVATIQGGDGEEIGHVFRAKGGSWVPYIERDGEDLPNRELACESSAEKARVALGREFRARGRRKTSKLVKGKPEKVPTKKGELVWGVEYE